MKPIPVAFHLGPLEVHTYGIGLALTFWFAYWYFGRRLTDRGYRTDWLVALFLWVIGAAVVGARAVHVLAHWTTYSQNPGQILAIWHGGLSSFGGLLFAVPTALVVVHRRCPELSVGRGLDIVAPVLMAAWAIGRLLGPQLMVAGGGHPTHQWFGMYYATQPGRRLPVPIFQAAEDAAVYLVLILIERRLDRWPDGTARTGYPAGVVIGTAMVLWGTERALDQHLWLTTTSRVAADLVQAAGVALFVGGLVVLFTARRNWQRWRLAGAPGGRAEPDLSPDGGAVADPHDPDGPRTEGPNDASSEPDDAESVRRSASPPTPPPRASRPVGR
jgi:phosphatidylglycerol---prolipoprotein diacylglyceryl transferase